MDPTENLLIALSVNLKCKQYKDICFPVMCLLVHKDEEPNQLAGDGGWGRIICCQSLLVDSWVLMLPRKDGRQIADLTKDKSISVFLILEFLN